jgi:hypothetical protein
MADKDHLKPRSRDDGLHASRADYDNATDLNYIFPNDRYCGVRIEDGEPPERVAKKLRHLSMLIEEQMVKNTTTA